MALEHQGRAVAAADPGQQVGAAGLDLVHLDIGASGAGQVGDVVRQARASPGPPSRLLLTLLMATRPASVSTTDVSDGQTSRGERRRGSLAHAWMPGRLGWRNGALAAQSRVFSKKLLRRGGAIFGWVGDAPGAGSATGGSGCGAEWARLWQGDVARSGREAGWRGEVGAEMGGG